MQKTIYIGRYTSENLECVEQKVKSLESIRAQYHLHIHLWRQNLRERNADYVLSLNETLSVLDPLPNRTVKELIATMYEYQEIFSDIQHRPERYTTEHLTPAIAQAWYANQILAIRGLLQKGGRA